MPKPQKIKTATDHKPYKNYKDGNRLKVLERDATAHWAYIQPVIH